MKKLKLYNLGTLPYQQAWDLQNKLAEQIAGGGSAQGHPPALLLLQHPHVYTFGRQGKTENLLWSEEELVGRGIDLVWSDRGGDITYHGPGQLVGYPLLPLGGGQIEVDTQQGTARIPQGDYVGYLRQLEKVIIQTLMHFGVPSGQIEGQTGVWVQPHVPSLCRHCPPEFFEAPAKIASIGVKVDARGVSRHGFALNVDPDMRYWDGMLACGLENQNKASLAYFLDPVPTVAEVASVLAGRFAQVFNYEIV